MLSIRCSIGFGLTILTASSAAGADWYKGQTHSHSSNSSDVRTYNLKNDENLRKNDPEPLARIYKAKGYNFLAITDHNRQTEIPAGVEDKGFLMVKGEEITSKGAHVIGLNMKSKSGIKSFAIQEDVDKINSLGGFPILAHPVYMKTVDEKANENMTEDKVAEAKGIHTLEVFNGVCELKGKDLKPLGNSEELWDAVLSRGKLWYGNAVDDNHDWRFCDTGWTVVWADELKWDALRKAMEGGDFFASCGVEVTSVSITAKSYAVKSRNAEKIEFIGKEGKVLSTVDGASGSYEFKGDELYVRARLSNSKVVEKEGGHKKGLTYTYPEKAWTQPVFVKDAKEKQLGE